MTYGMAGLQEGLPVITEDDYSFVRVGKEKTSPKLYLHTRKPIIVKGRINQFYVDTIEHEEHGWILSAMREFVPAHHPPFIVLVRGEIVKTQATVLLRNDEEGYYLLEMNRNTFVQILERGVLVSLFNRDGRLELQQSGKKKNKHR